MRICVKIKQLRKECEVSQKEAEIARLRKQLEE